MNFELTSGTMRELVNIDDSLIANVITAESQGSQSDAVCVLEEALDSPIGMDKLETLVGSKSRIAIIVDDSTRPTPTALILPMVLQRLDSVGVPRENIKITIGTGLHRAPTPEEVEKILGKDLSAELDVAANDARNESCYSRAGITPSGREIFLNKRVTESDLVITIGLVKSHAFAGFTGGAKSILPAVSSRQTILENHCFKDLEYPNGILGSCEKSKPRQEMEAAARLLNPFIINVILDENDTVIKAASGDVVEAHRYLVNQYKLNAEKNNCQKVDIALVYGGIAGSVNLYQALFGCNVVRTTERPILNEGGTVILFSECREGMGSPLFEEMIPKYRNPEDVLAALSTNPVIEDQWAVQFLCAFLEKISVVVVSTGIDQDSAEKIGLDLQPSAQDALAKTLSRYENPKIAVVENPDILVVNAGA